MTVAVPEELLVEDDWVDQRWRQLHGWLQRSFGIEPGIEGVLFLIGVRESGSGYQPRLKKERKQELIMDGTYRAFEAIGVYRRVSSGVDSEYSWEKSRPMPALSVEEQEKLLKVAILRYFSELNVGMDT